MFYQYRISSARILTGAPSAGRMIPLHRKIPLQGHTSLSSFFFFLYGLLPNKEMTLIKIYMLSIKIGMCLSPIACYHRCVRALWLTLKLTESFLDFSGFGVEPNTASGNDGVHNCEKSHFEFLAHYFRINSIFLPAFCWTITPCPTRYFCQWFQPRQDLEKHRSLAA